MIPMLLFRETFAGGEASDVFNDYRPWIKNTSPLNWGGVIVVDVEQGFCQSQVDKKAQIEDWEEEDFVW